MATELEAFTVEPVGSLPGGCEAEAVTSDGHILAFRDAAKPVLDEEIGPPFDLVMDCAFTSRGTAVWWTQRADSPFRVARALS
jgi:hypothetical protein